jgi:tRNA pseudouridine38-40 synthase
MRNVRLIVEYDGTDLCGWQRQTNGPTVQAHLEEALGQLLQQPTAVVGASRTDAGVHARGQVAAFKTDRTIPAHGIRRGLNTLLPPAIAVVDAQDVDDDFHPRFSATGKRYRYTLLVRPDRSPRWRTRAWLRPGSIDVPAIAREAAPLIGEHDFAAFRATGCTAQTTRRRIDAIDVSTVEPDVVAIDVAGNAFLRNMVRIVVGTLVDAAEGRLAPGQVGEILASCDRTKAGQTAPARGLELMEVRYDGTRPRL